MNYNPPATAPCRVCGARVPDGFTALVGLCPSERDRKLVARWRKRHGGVAHWPAGRRRQWERIVSDFIPMPSFLCAYCLAIAQREADGKAIGMVDLDDVTDESRTQYVDFAEGKPKETAAESWAFRSGQIACAMGIPFVEIGGVAHVA